MTVTPTRVPSSWKTWVMCFLRPYTAVAIASLGSLYLDVHTGRQVESLQRVHRTGGGLLDIYEALVRVQVKVLAGVLVLEGPPDHSVPAALRRQRNGAEYKGPGPLCGLDYRLGSLVYDLVVIGLELDPYLRYSHRELLLQDLGDDASSHGAPTLPYGEVEALVHSDGRDQLHLHHRVVPGHHHLYPLLDRKSTRLNS